MLTVMCPNCQHLFPAPGCCNGAAAAVAAPAASATTSATFNLDHRLPTSASGGLLFVDLDNGHGQQVTISTKCGIQSGGCLIQNSNAEVLLHSTSATSPFLEVRSKLSGGGCLVQNQEQQPHLQAEQCRPQLISEEQLRNSFEQAQFQRSHSISARLESPPSGCQELPGTRCEDINSGRKNSASNSCECRCCCYCRCCYNYCKNGHNKPHCCCAAGNESNPQCWRRLCQAATSLDDQNLARCCRCKDNAPDYPCSNVDASLANSGRVTDSSKPSGDVRIQVSATVHLPAPSSTTVSSCTFNITASTSSAALTTSCTSEPSTSSNALNNRFRNHFNGGGIVTLNNTSNGSSNINDDDDDDNNRNNDEAPGTPVSWLATCPWSFDDDYMPDKELARLAKARRLLQVCGWYHEGLSWHQSENLLKDAPIGRWLMRDSSDSRYTFAISVQTHRGPTSVRVYYVMGKFRLDSEPRLTLSMPVFNCPIKMLEHYCDYSKRMTEQRQEVWIDFKGHMYAHIYLAEPLHKEVRSLSHLARIAVNKSRGKLEKEKERLPPVIRDYLNEYPYTL